MPVLGMRGSGSFAVTGQRPENWREGILDLFPNGHTPLTAILSMLKSEEVDDPIYNWFQKDLPGERAFINNGAGYGTGDTVLKVDDGAGVGQARMFVRGTIILNETTLEQMLVVQDPVDANSIVVSRGVGEVAAAAMSDNEAIFLVSTAYEQGASIPTAVSYDPTQHQNFVQTIRVALSLTRIAMRTRLRTGDAYERAKKEALELMSMRIEKALIWGQKSSSVVNGQLLYTMKGLTRFLSTNVFTPASNQLTEILWDGYLKDIFKYGSAEKLALCGGTFLNVLNGLVKGKVTINAVAGDDAYGMKMQEYITPFGILYLKLHPLMNIHPVYTEDCLIVDTDFLSFRHIDDLVFLKHRQDPGEDGRKDEFLVDASIEVQHEKVHAWVKAVKSFA